MKFYLKYHEKLLFLKEAALNIKYGELWTSRGEVTFSKQNEDLYFYN